MQKSFGEKLRGLREDRDLTQSRLAEKLNMTQRKISYIENDKCEPSLDDLRAFCNFFNVSADYFLEITIK